MRDMVDTGCVGTHSGEVESCSGQAVHEDATAALLHCPEQLTARLLAAPTRLRADPAVLVMVCVALTLVAAALTCLRAGFDDRARHVRVVFRLPRGHPTGGGADIRTVEIEPDALREHLHVLFAEAGVGAHRAGLRAGVALVDAAGQDVSVDVE